jgi:hypothetical protein
MPQTIIQTIYLVGVVATFLTFTATVLYADYQTVRGRPRR